MIEKLFSISTIFRYLTTLGDKIVLWQSKEISEDNIAPPSTTNYRFAAKSIVKYSIPTIKFNGDCLKQNSVSFIDENVLNVYISYNLDARSKDLNTD